MTLVKRWALKEISIGVENFRAEVEKGRRRREFFPGGGSEMLPGPQAEKKKKKPIYYYFRGKCL